MTPEETAIRQSLEIINNTIQDLCKRRDLLAAQLPKAPREVMPRFFGGKKIEDTSGRKRKAAA